METRMFITTMAGITANKGNYMQPNIDQVNAEVQMMKRQTDQYRDETRADFIRIFEKLEAIHDDLAKLKATPICPDPGACVRLESESKTLRGALEKINSQVGVLQADKQAILGAKTIILGACILVGWLINAAIGYFHK